MGDGATTFNLPDFRDKSPAGTGAIVGAVGSYHGNATMALGYNISPHYHKYKLMYDLDTHSNGDTPIF